MTEIKIQKGTTYELDMISIDEKVPMIPALTEKNRDFINGIVKIDSNYSRDTKIVPPSKNYYEYIKKHVSDDQINNIPKGYKGSIPFWFHQIEFDVDNYKANILGAMFSINTSNSTRVSVKDILRLSDRIVEKYPDKDSLREALEKKFIEEDREHILSVLIRKDGNERFEISFASKFCAYASICLKTDFQYAKYDNIVSQNLNKYIKIYLNKDVNINKVSITQEHRQGTQEEQYAARLKVYANYSTYIERIIDQIKDEVEMTKEDLDHIIWYGLKNITTEDE